MRYIGCKKTLLENIRSVVDIHIGTEARSFCDIFSGTATVARYFKRWFEVTSNDLLYFSYVLQMATVKNDSIPQFSLLTKNGISDPIDYLNNLSVTQIETLDTNKRFFQNTYSPKGGRMYFNEENALRIDYARNTIETWRENNLISNNEYYYLVACVIEGVPFVSNISGTYGAYHKTWDKRTYKKFELYKLPVTQNHKNNNCFNEDGVELIKSIYGDILYIDPPYNQRQYLPNYHILETVAKYDYPQVRGVTGLRPYENCKSDFCNKRKVQIVFEDLIKNARFKHIIMSYSTDGLMSVEAIEAIMTRYGIPKTFTIHEIPFRRFKSRDTVLSDPLKELIIYVKKNV